MSLKNFINKILPNTYDDNNFDDDGNLNKNYNSYKKTGLIAEILEDHFNKTYLNNKNLIDTYRPNAQKEIQKVIDCHNKDLGCSIFECPECNNLMFISNTCKSRCCSSCGYKYKLQRVSKIMETAFDVKHRQIVFTIPVELRPYFFNIKNISILFNAVCKTIYSLANDKYKQNKNNISKKKYKSLKKFLPGFFAFLHTFGRDLKFNPHIHILIAELKMDKDGNTYNWNYFNYDALSKRFMKILLDELKPIINSNFYSLKNKLYQKYPNGFYVYAEPKNFKSIKEGVEYTARYCGRLPISENRILNYDGSNVTFSYNDHNDDSYHEITLPAEEFILLLLRHLIPENFKIIRYYGFYNKKHDFNDKISMLIDSSKRTIRKEMLKYVNCIKHYFNRNPLSCPKCGTTTTYLTTYNGYD